MIQLQENTVREREREREREKDRQTTFCRTCRAATAGPINIVNDLLSE